MNHEPLFEVRLNITFHDVYDGREIVEFLEKLFQLRLTLVDWSTISAGTSMPEVVIRGTRKNLTAWIIHYFERNVVRVRDLPPRDGGDGMGGDRRDLRLAFCWIRGWEI